MKSIRRKHEKQNFGYVLRGFGAKMTHHEKNEKKTALDIPKRKLYNPKHQNLTR